MKKIFSFLLSVIIFITAIPTVNAIYEQEKPSISASVNTSNKVSKPSVSAEAFILYCADNGQVIYSSNENKKMKPASTTKLMTTLITLEEADSLNKTVTFTKEMIAEGSSIYLKVGDKLTLRDLAAGMMMASGNDAANAAALSISGSSEKFAQRMNEKAKQIGMKSTNFVTPSGLDDDNHYTNAYDLAILMSYALENEDFAELTAQKSATIKFIEPSSRQTTYTNHNRLLSLYDYCIGGKTGYTMAAGRCLVTAAKKDGLTLVCVTLNDKNDWNDHIDLYNYGFEQLFCYETTDKDFFADIPCVGGENSNNSNADFVTVTGEKNTAIILPMADKNKIERKIMLDNFLYAPIKENEFVGKINYLINGKVIETVNIIAINKINSKKEVKTIFTFIKELFTYG